MYIPSTIVNYGYLTINDDIYSSLNKDSMFRFSHTITTLNDYPIKHSGKFLRIETDTTDYTSVTIVNIEKITPHYRFQLLKKNGYTAFKKIRNHHYHITETVIMIFHNVGFLGRTLHDNSTMWKTLGLIIAYNDYRISQYKDDQVLHDYQQALLSLSIMAQNNYEGSLEQSYDNENCPMIQAKNKALINLDTIMNMLH